MAVAIGGLPGAALKIKTVLEWVLTPEIQKPGGSTSVFSTAAYIVRYIQIPRKNGHSSPHRRCLAEGEWPLPIVTPPPEPRLAGGVFLLLIGKADALPKINSASDFHRPSAKCVQTHFYWLCRIPRTLRPIE
jgi:hypothetical protein